MSRSPKVSVVVPTYNYARFLDEAIPSVLNQTFTDFELIIVDNCSTDNTDAVVKKYLSDSRVSFYKNETNLGLVGNWNKCLEYATGEYIKFLCADDKFHPQILERFVRIMEQHPTIAIVTNYSDIFGEKIGKGRAPFVGLVNGQTVRESMLTPGNRNWLRNPSAVMFRKKDADAVGLFHPRLFHGTDLEYYLRLLTKGDAYFVPESLSYTRSHSNAQGALIRKKKYEKIFERYDFIMIVKNGQPAVTDSMRSLVDLQVKRRAIRSAAAMYELLPRLYKKDSRRKFKTAFQIGYTEGVLLTPLSKYLQWKYIKRLLDKK